MRQILAMLARSAVRAPSGDNMQPWRVVVNESGHSVTLVLDETCDQSPMNANQNMSVLAFGTAIENIVETATHNGLAIEIDDKFESARRVTIRVLRFSAAEGEIPTVIQQRHTNRHRYDGRALPADFHSNWRDVNRNDANVEVIWITDRDRLYDVANAIGRADAEMFARRANLQAFLSNVRFDLPDCARAEEGLCVGSLELTPFERRVLPWLAYVPEVLLNSVPLRHSFQVKAESLVRSASGVCLIVSRNIDLISRISTGRIMERVWLRLNKLGFDAQPMMSIPVLLNARQAENTAIGLFETVLDSSYSAFAGVEEASLPMAILRFGTGPKASARTGRRQWSSMSESNLCEFTTA